VSVKKILCTNECVGQCVRSSNEVTCDDERTCMHVGLKSHDAISQIPLYTLQLYIDKLTQDLYNVVAWHLLFMLPEWCLTLPLRGRVTKHKETWIWVKHFLTSDYENLQKEFFFVNPTLSASLTLILFPQHDPPTHKNLFRNLTFGHVRKYSWATHVLAPFFFTAMSFDTTSTLTTLHLEWEESCEWHAAWNAQCVNPSPELLFYRGAVIPDVIPSVPCEFKQLQVYYHDAFPFLFPMSFNESFFQNQTLLAPHVQVFGDGGPLFTRYYTLLLVDPDAPSPTNRSIS